jgi:hypothetical protein
LDTPGTLVLVAHIVSEGPLDTTGHVMPVTVAHRFKSEKLFRTTSEIGNRGGAHDPTVSGLLMNALVTPICHSSFAIPVSFSICTHPDLVSPVQV